MSAPKALVVTTDDQVSDDRVVAYMCKACHAIYEASHTPESRLAAREHATRCCDPRCASCGARPEGAASYCAACARANRARNEAARFARADKVALADYRGEYLYTEEVAAFDGTPYHPDYDQLVAAAGERGAPPPAYAYACTKHKLGLDVGDTLAAHLEHVEGGIDRIDEAQVRRLQELVDAWIDAQGDDATWYEEDGSVAVLLPPSAGDAAG